ncbi:MAG TPA: selenocysteine-specific translation elongation factor [Chloroflexi bacterium]|nr:selenocysteine-specific translation elongation factor [Chloroflexota bacterium]
MRVIGTAGHVDHGKSTLIEALTGTHPDRLREEREREMTIVLGFAWMTLPNGEEIGIVDVPGHRDFIENMLSGVGAIDAALFVVAADEGVMPQTREHLAILDLLQIQGGVVALTKIDMVDDPDWLDLIEADLQETLAGTVLDSAPMVRVSARSGAGIPELRQLLADTLSGRPPRPDLGRPRLPVDRVFTMPGFGTIATGTLTDGHFQVGEDVIILPQELRSRIRGLQTHKNKEQIAVPGSRTAVNITGVDVDQVQRGDVIAYPGAYKSSRRLDVHFRMLGDVSQPLRHNTEVKLFVGASEVIARLRLLGADVLKPGEEGWLQLELGAPVVVVRGDRYILRRPSPGETLGGGIILDPQPAGRHKRFNAKLIQRLEALVGGTPEDVVLQAALALGIAPQKEILAHSSLEESLAQAAFQKLLDDRQLLVLDIVTETIRPDTLFISKSFWLQFTAQAEKEILAYQKAYPLRLGVPREELKSRLKQPARIFNAALSRWFSEGKFAETSLRQDVPGASVIPVVHMPEHQIALNSQQQQKIDRLLARFAENPAAPPTIKECTAEVGDELFNAMIDLGYVIPLNAEVVYRREDYLYLADLIRLMITTQGSISVAQVRDQLQTSRRYVLALLEHFDAISFTVRDGDVRKLKQR